MKSQRKKHIIESKRQTIDSSFIPALHVQIGDGDMSQDNSQSIQQFMALPTIQSSSPNARFFGFDQSEFGDLEPYSLRKMTKMKSSIGDLSYGTINTQIMQEQTEQLVSNLVNRTQKVQSLLKDASKIHIKQRKPFVKTLKQFDETTQVELKFVKLQRKDQLNILRKERKKEKYLKKIEKDIQEQIQR